MPGSNTTGVPNTADYLLGRGAIYLALLNSGTGLQVGGWRHAGNAPDMKASVAATTLDHFSSLAGLKTLDKTVTISQELDLSFTLEEINFENLAAFFSGNQAIVTNPAIAGFTNYVMVADGTLVLARWYDVVTSAGIRAYDLTASKLTITTNETTPVAMVLGTDYTVDTQMGRIFILPTSTVAATALGSMKGLKVTLAADAPASPTQQVQGLTQTSVTVAVKFISQNAANGGRQFEMQIHSTQLVGDGDFSLIGDTFTQLAFKCKAQQNAALGGANSPTITITSVNTPRT